MSADAQAKKPAAKPGAQRRNIASAAPKVFDVMRPGKAIASSTSRPIIVGHKPKVKDSVLRPDAAAPMLTKHSRMVTPAETVTANASAPPQAAAPISSNSTPEIAPSASEVLPPELSASLTANPITQPETPESSGSTAQEAGDSLAVPDDLRTSLAQAAFSGEATSETPAEPNSTVVPDVDPEPEKTSETPQPPPPPAADMSQAVISPQLAPPRGHGIKVVVSVIIVVALIIAAGLALMA